MNNKEIKENKGNSALDEYKPFFSENDLSDNPESKLEIPYKVGKKPKIDKNLVLDTIRRKAPIHISDLKRELKIGYSTLWNIIREFEFVGLIQTKEFFDEKTQNHYKMVFIPEIKKEASKNAE